MHKIYAFEYTTPELNSSGLAKINKCKSLPGVKDSLIFNVLHYITPQVEIPLA